MSCIHGVTTILSPCPYCLQDKIDKLQADLAVQRELLKEANEMLAEAIVCGPKLREYTPLRQRIDAALAKVK